MSQLLYPTYLTHLSPEEASQLKVGDQLFFSTRNAPEVKSIWMDGKVNVLLRTVAAITDDSVILDGDEDDFGSHLLFTGFGKNSTSSTYRACGVGLMYEAYKVSNDEELQEAMLLNIYQELEEAAEQLQLAIASSHDRMRLVPCATIVTKDKFNELMAQQQKLLEARKAASLNFKLMPRR